LAWIIDQLTLLAEAFGEPLMPQRLELYVRDLCDLTPEQLRIAFQRARRELKFFPKIAELRALAGETRKELTEAGAIAAWHAVLDLISKWGVDRWEHASYGPPPELGARTEYAIRIVGGLNRINRCSDSEFGYMQKQFCDAWISFDVSKQGFREIVGKLDGETLGTVKRLGPGAREAKDGDKMSLREILASAMDAKTGSRTRPDRQNSPLFDEEARQKRIAELKAQAVQVEEVTQ
jgi:hypothetical protein